MASSKYSVSPASRWRLKGDRPRLSDHMLDRYDDRTPTDAVAPETAYEQSSRVALLQRHEHFRPHDTDQIRVYFGGGESGRWGVVMPIADNCVVTCYRIESIDHAEIRGYLWGLAIEWGVYE